MRFELTDLLQPAVFKTALLNHSSTLPMIKIYQASCVCSTNFFALYKPEQSSIVGSTLKVAVIHQSYLATTPTADFNKLRAIIIKAS